MFVIDECLCPGLGYALMALNEDVKPLQEVVSRGTKDPELLALLGKKGWFLVTRDPRMRRRPAEADAWKLHKVGVFMMLGKSRNKCELVLQFMRAWAKMKAKADKAKGPFCWGVRPQGGALEKISLD